MACSLALRLDFCWVPGDLTRKRPNKGIFQLYTTDNSGTHILLHAHATIVSIRLVLDDRHIQLQIEENGKGFAAPPRLVDLVRQGQYGLVVSVERAEAIGETLTIVWLHGRGTTIFANLNL